jgi:KUP system potassium uptake protein
MGDQNHGHGHGPKSPKELAALSLAALGVVYGDIGTSPLYTMQECFAHEVKPTHDNVLGVLSLIYYSLFLVVIVKYLTFIMRADNKGEGGILALLSLVGARRSGAFLVLLGLFGAALLYGDGVITPAISVLSAVEGLDDESHRLRTFILPITAIVLVGLFLVQRRGTAGIGAVFGPTMLLWFTMIGVLGLPWVFRHPEVLRALDPRYAVRFFLANHFHGFAVLGSVVLCITGGEALYADMGHFGRKPIMIAWYGLVFPALLVNYSGQAALLLERGTIEESQSVFYRLVVDEESPFFKLAGPAARYPVVAIAAVATVVASQALISGAYSLTRQAVQLGFSPRVTIVHTSGKAEGQIYIPEVNWALMVACLALVFAFKASTALAAAYGIAVTGTMGITSILFYVVCRRKFGMPAWKAGLLLALFLSVDMAFFSANLLKFVDGGWFPIACAALIFTLMTTWKRGREALGASMREATLPLDAFLEDLRTLKPHRVSGTAVFMTSNLDGAPPILLHHFKHNKVLHKRIILLAVSTTDEPEVPVKKRFEVEEAGEGFFRVKLMYGFMQTPNVPAALELAKKQGGLDVDLDDLSFFLGRETLLVTGKSTMARWRKKIFSLMSKNARPATAFFGIPPNRVVELGTQIEL